MREGTCCNYVSCCLDRAARERLPSGWESPWLLTCDVCLQVRASELRGWAGREGYDQMLRIGRRSHFGSPREKQSEVMSMEKRMTTAKLSILRLWWEWEVGRD